MAGVLERFLCAARNQSSGSDPSTLGFSKEALSGYIRDDDPLPRVRVGHYELMEAHQESNEIDQKRRWTNRALSESRRKTWMVYLINLKQAQGATHGNQA